MRIFNSVFKNRNSQDFEAVQLGKIKGQLFKTEKLTEGQLNHHVHIVGASGFGKTVLLSHIIRQRIENNKGLLFIDLKGDIETIKKLSGYAKSANRKGDLQIFSISDQGLSISYNLIGRGTANQLRDRIMMSLTWSEEYYKNQSGSFLLRLMIGLCWLRDNQDLKIHIGTVLNCSTSVDKVLALGNLVSQEFLKIKDCFEYCVDFLSNSENFKSIQGLRSQLESIVYSDFGDQVTSDEYGIDLFDSIKESKIVFMFLDTRRYGETAKAIGRFILQDLKSASAKIDGELSKDQRKPFSVIIDEFADLAQEDFIGFLDRARSSKMSVIVAHQEICDLLRISPEFAGRLMGNTSTLYAFLQKRPESAELISAMAGTRKVWKETVQSQKLFFIDLPTGGKSLREVEEFNIHPNVIKSLTVGKCVVVKKYPHSRAYLVAVAPEGRGVSVFMRVFL